MAATYDNSTGVGSVSKGDVQTALGWNNASFQSNAGTVSFTSTVNVTQTVPVTASDGQKYDAITTWTYDKPVTAVATKDGQGRINGWILQGPAVDRDAIYNDTWGSHTDYVRSNTIPAGETLVGYWFNDTVITTTVNVQVNGHAVPNSPVVPV